MDRHHKIDVTKAANEVFNDDDYDDSTQNIIDEPKTISSE